LKAFSSFGDIIYFGIGVRHVLRTLVQTSQGASSVALVAALTEGHSTMYGVIFLSVLRTFPLVATGVLTILRRYTAYVLYEMTKIMKSPTEITPSYAQWERYAEVCAGLFSTSIFGQKVAQILR